MNASAVWKSFPLFLLTAFSLPVFVVMLQSGQGQALPPQIQQLKTVFMGIFLESLPFLLLGVLLSSLVQSFMKDRWVRRLAHVHPLTGVIAVSLLGIVFPLCECGMIPAVRRLIMKGLPPYMAVSFLLSGPVLNPVVFASTAMAFRGQPEMAAGRMGLAFSVSVLIGLAVYRFLPGNPLKRSLKDGTEGTGGQVNNSLASGLWRTLPVQAGNELLEMMKYLTLGALLTSFVQVFVAADKLHAMGEGAVVPYLFMMGFAFVLSLCSSSDAFIAASFSASFSPGPLIAFLVLGPMLDFKSLLMLLSSFRPVFLLVLALLAVMLVLLGSMAFGALAVSF